MTLVEVVMVLAILVALAGVAMVQLQSTSDTAHRTVAMVSATTIRDAVIQFWADCKYAYPTSSTTDQRIQIGHLLEKPTLSSFPFYDPDIGLGWNGAYLDVTSSRPYVVDTGNGFTTTYGNTAQLAIRDPFINQDLDSDGVNESGSPFVIQEPTLAALASSGTTYSMGVQREVRIVSAGPNGLLEINESEFTSALQANPTLAGDDIYVSFTLQ